MAIRRATISVALLFFLALIFMGPNQNSYHAQLFSPFLSPIYAGLELGSPWSFYAPDPGGPPTRLEWEVLDERGVATRSGHFPENRSTYFLNERHLRRVVFSRFLFGSDVYFMNVGAHWICRSNPDAHGLRLWRAMGKIPDFQKVRSGEVSLFSVDFEDRVAVGNIFCSDFKKNEFAGQGGV